MARIVWKPGHLVSFKLRDDLYTIAQMESGSIMRFFDVKNKNGEWKNINLNNSKQLFRVFVGRVVNKNLAFKKIKDETVIPSQKILDEYWIHPYTLLIDGDHYKGDSSSFSFLGGKLISLNWSNNMSITNATVIKHDLSTVNDKSIIENYELTSMWGDKDLGDRLRRYFDTGIDRDDLKFEVFPGLWDDREKLRPLTRRLPIPMR
ncbi:hypothetical protein KXR87_05240 [Yokenella regensburgei]